MKKSDLSKVTAEAAGSQYAALCYRRAADGGAEILLITSRETGRWVLPKGWLIRGMTGAKSALREAYEEAGVVGRVTGQALGMFSYLKALPGGTDLPCVVTVYPVKVRKLKDSFPEAGQRERGWFAPARAAALVTEPELREILVRFSLPAEPSRPGRD